MNCQRCQHPHWVKNRFLKEKQHYKCKKCNYQWTENHTHRGRPTSERALAVYLYYHGLSMNVIAKIIEASPSTILKRIRNFSIQHAQPQSHRQILSCLNLMRCGTISRKAIPWICKTLCRDTGELIAWKCGHRDKATLKKLLEGLAHWPVIAPSWHHPAAFFLATSELPFGGCVGNRQR